MRVSWNLPGDPQALTASLEGLTALNAYLLHRFELPDLYDSGVVYQRESVGQENWLTAPEVLRHGGGDCEDLAAWRAAEYRVYHATPAMAAVVRTGAKTFHAIVVLPDGRVEDPSRLLGM